MQEPTQEPRGSDPWKPGSAGWPVRAALAVAALAVGASLIITRTTTASEAALFVAPAFVMAGTEGRGGK
ncbi:hypothetical protein M1P56_31255 [Streptomyces sp. HU2014]|uniref:Uncharacterized protein n=1 Tax=Streptomyces albireticuli TaxID=1940 RepID=A0A1Z2L2U5_9ACTN|nr:MULTISPECIES: hypothetical protein [Streptomyces]ARZ68541.1 hypothetical protein SMD11_2894 [Streptomyces albireticuli]UQI48482.1 hypothetical protein M1P56_31255 [Streptomyces sp. HU2014]